MSTRFDYKGLDSHKKYERKTPKIDKTRSFPFDYLYKVYVNSSISRLDKDNTRNLILY